MTSKQRLFVVAVVGLLCGGCATGLEGVGAGVSPAGDAARCQSLTSGIGVNLQVHSSDHFLLLASADDASAAATGRFLDQVYSRFYDSFMRAGFSPRPQSDRLVCVCFDSYNQLDSYGRAADSTEASWMDGYYSYRTNRIAIVRASAAHQVARAPATPAGRNVAAAAAPYGAASGDGLNLRTTTHELAHQLAFNSGLQRRDATYPFWLTEGLATNFEADASGAFGLDPKDPCHRCRLGDAKAGHRLIPLSSFTGMMELSSAGGQSTQDAYAQAWGLFHFLLANHRDGLRRYMADLTGVQFARVDSQSLQRRFIDDFGPIEPLEKDFLRFIDAQNR